MLYYNLKKLAVIGGFAIVAVVAIYIFALLGARPETPNEAAEQIVEQTADAAIQQPQATEQASSSLPAGVSEAFCGRYADLPEDVVPCQPALDYVIQNYGSDISDISSFGLVAQAADGTVMPFVAGQPIVEGARLMWLASSHQSGAVLLDAKDLSVIKEKT